MEGFSSADPARPLVSVVTPVYNGEAYLAECIESVLAQTHGNWEYVVADNCSTDRSGEIARAYAERDPRIRVHRFEDYAPVIANWNRTLALLSPESVYTKFVLCDDWLYPECLERMVAVAERHPSVGIVGAYRVYGSDVDLDALPVDEELVDGREMSGRSLLGGRYVFGSPTSIMFRSDLVRERAPEFFEESRLEGSDPTYVNFHADTDVCYALLQKSDFGFVHQVLSYSRIHDESITTRWTAGVGTWLPGHLATLMRFGPSVLPRDEFEQRARKVLERYELYLVRNVITGRLFRDRVFRTYHRESLRRLRPAVQESALRGLPLRALLGLLTALVRA